MSKERTTPFHPFVDGRAAHGRGVFRPGLLGKTGRSPCPLRCHSPTWPIHRTAATRTGRFSLLRTNTLFQALLFIREIQSP